MNKRIRAGLTKDFESMTLAQVMAWGVDAEWTDILRWRLRALGFTGKGLCI